MTVQVEHACSRFEWKPVAFSDEIAGLTSPPSIRWTVDSSAGLMPTEAGGKYLPEAPYLRETKTYLNCMHASESTLDSGTASHSSRYDMLAIISSRYQYGPFLFVVAEVMSSYLTTDGLKNFFLYFRSLP